MVTRHIAFSAALRQEVQAAIDERRAVRNLYDGSGTPGDLQHAIDDALHRPSTEDDTHPGPTERFRLLNGIEAAAQEVPEGDVWQLFVDPDGLATEMTGDIDRQVKG